MIENFNNNTQTALDKQNINFFLKTSEHANNNSRFNRPSR